PHELSGGQLQRISVLRSMLLEPLLIIADEPVSMLDVSVRADLLNILMNLVKEFNMAMVFISHDIAVINYVSEKIAVMYLGRIVESGTCAEILQDPLHPYTKVLISNFPTLSFTKKTEPIHIEGEPPTPVNPGPGCYFAKRCYKAGEICFKEYPPMKECGGTHQASCHFL
ncbi:MAG: ABC transporter ATP-binding protein, partial [Symbiobacteriaceae bacterium]|nr:ABC transporter ATP-binding protein [Symbiobacteriaceae bacterium]